MSTIQQSIPAKSTSKKVAPVEWQTCLLALVIYCSYGLITYFHSELPGIVTFIFGSAALAWFTSLQHEVLHNHPTRNDFLNELLVFPALTLWLPYRIYRQSHLQHHNDENLTDPLEDPESWYFLPEKWRSTNLLHRKFRIMLNTLVGRLTLGPALMIYGLLWTELSNFVSGKLDYRAWGMHLLGSIVSLYWILEICGIPLWEYCIIYVYPASSWILLRSYAEHQAASSIKARITAVETNLFFSTLFLNNNIHPVHHDKPYMPWYRIPSYWAKHRAQYLSLNEQYCYQGYGEIIKRFAFAARNSPIWPLAKPQHGLEDLPNRASTQTYY